MSTGEYWAELENNHHYIIVDSEHDRTYYCPAEMVANEISRILNDKNKKIRELNRRLLIQYKKPIVFEIERRLEHRYEHVAFVTNEELALDFCEKHKDCSYHEIHITKYRNELEGMRAEVPCCGSCDHASPQIQSDGSSIIFCNSVQQKVTENEYCGSWEYEP